MRPAILLAPLLCLACAREDTAALYRRPLSPATTSGWVRVPLDAGAQRDLRGAWIGDAAGRSIPFQESYGVSHPFPVTQLLTGRDAEGHPTAEFSPKPPLDWQEDPHQRLKLDLDLEGPAPWVVRVKAERQIGGGHFVAYDFPSPPHLYDLPPSGSHRTLDLPWDGQRYRLTFLPTQGEAPRIRGLSVRAEVTAEALDAEAVLEGTLAPVPGQPRTWRVSLPDRERVVGLDLDLAPPAAPLRPDLRWGEGAEADRSWPCTGAVWNLPALGTKAARITLTPVLARTLAVTLPEGAAPLGVRILVRRQSLIFPAEAGQTYFLHLGGEGKPAPGNLQALPSVRTLVATEALGLGSREPDPQGLPRRIGADQRARPWMPWIAGVAVLGMAVVAWSLLSGKVRPDA